MGCINAIITIEREPLVAECALICDIATFYARFDNSDPINFRRGEDTQNAKVIANTSWELTVEK